jgi:peptide/nickel transport system substrate-binding protein
LPVGDLVDSWGISFDRLVYNFHLRENASWHDGTPVKAEDVLFTVELMRDADSVLPQDIKNFWGKIEVIALGDYDLQFRLQEPFAPFFDYLSFGIVPKHLLSGMTYADMVNSEFNLNPIGSGPYRFNGLITEGGRITGVTLSANTSYYNKPPFINEFVFRYFPDAVTAWLGYQDGSVQGLGDVPLDIIEQALADPDISVYSTIQPKVSMILLNLENSDVTFFQEEDIRRALLMGLDRKGMLARLFNGQGIMADMPILPNSWAYYSGNPRVDQDVEKAKMLLNEAGFTVSAGGNGVRSKEGNPLQFSLVHPDDAYHTAIAEAIQNDWQKLGINTTLTGVPYDSLVLDYLQPLTYEAALVELDFTRAPDPDPYPFWDQAQKKGGQNYSQWDNKVASQYLEEARVNLDIDERAKLYRNFQVIFADELPALPLFYPSYSFAIDGAVQGVKVGPMFDTSDRFWNVNEWYLIAQSAGESEQQ